MPDECFFIHPVRNPDTFQTHASMRTEPIHQLEAKGAHRLHVCADWHLTAEVDILQFKDEVADLADIAVEVYYKRMQEYCGWIIQNSNNCSRILQALTWSKACSNWQWPFRRNRLDTITLRTTSPLSGSSAYLRTLRMMAS